MSPVFLKSYLQIPASREKAMSTEQQIEIVKRYLMQKICFGLQDAGNPTCRTCRLRNECAPLRRARLTYEERLLPGEDARAGDDAEFEAIMESMSKAKFEAMIAQALRRGAGYTSSGADSAAADHQLKAPNSPIPKDSQSHKGAEAMAEQQGCKASEGRAKGRPRTAKEKAGQVLALAARGMTRQVIARELGISLASVYRILKENR